MSRRTMLIVAGALLSGLSAAVLVNAMAPGDESARAMATVLVIAADVPRGGMITAEAALTFLGLGIPSNVPSWGGMLSDGAQYLSVAWWLATFPGTTIVFTVLATNLIGDWLRDVLDPRAESGSLR